VKGPVQDGSRRRRSRRPRAVSGALRAWAAIALAAAMASAAWGQEAIDSGPGRDATEATAAEEPETWHVSTYVSGAVGFRVIDSWSKGSWMRARTVVSAHPITTIVRGERYVVFDGLEGKGISIARSPRAIAEDAARGRPFGQDLRDLIERGGEEVGPVRLRGEDATMWRLTEESIRRTVWVQRRKPGLPLRVETFDRVRGQTITQDYASWSSGLGIPDAFFEPPAQVSLRRLDYEAYLEAVQGGGLEWAPVLYPDLLHGGRVR